MPRLMLNWPETQHVQIVEDASIAPGGCRVYAGGGQIDATLDEQLDRVVADLLPDRDGADDSPAYPLSRVRKPRTPGK